MKSLFPTFFPVKCFINGFNPVLSISSKNICQKNIDSGKPHNDLNAFSHPGVMERFFDDFKKEYRKGFSAHISKERQGLTPHYGIYRPICLPSASLRSENKKTAPAITQLSNINIAGAKVKMSFIR